MNYEGQQYENSLAIIGMSGRFPKCKDLEEYWEMICQGKEGITFFSKELLKEYGVSEEERNAPNYVPAAAILEGYEKFDNNFFDMNPREAELMDPQQRIFLLTCWEALESAGYSSDKTKAVIGVFGGSSMNSFLIHNLLNNREFIDKHEALQHIFIHGNINDYLCTRVSYKLNLKGPVMTVQTACSTSATAVYLGCQSLLNYDCDIALAGGVSIKVPQYTGYKVVEGGIFSTDGHCRAFDNNSTGTIFGNGAGVIVLKRLKDAMRDRDNIVAIIRGFGLNNDGNLKVGYTAPSLEGQREAILKAIDFSEVEPDDIGYVEMHGTGTKLGDLIEINAIDSAYKQFTQKKNYCPIGSVKANIGHLNAAAGIASLMKAALVVEKGIIPPQAAYENPNREIDFSRTPFYVNTKLREWRKDKRIAGVSSFGIGGTNVHFIIENYVDNSKKYSKVESDNIFTISGKTKRAAIDNAKKLKNYLIKKDNVNITDISKTILNGRKDFEYRIGFHASSKEELVNKLDVKIANQAVVRTDKDKKIVFLYPGQGTQYEGMYKELYYSSRRIKSIADKYFNILKRKVNFDVDKYKFFENETNNTEIVQPLLFLWEYVISEYLFEFGIFPDIVLGHSLGEYVAACVSKIITVEDTIDILIKRSQLANKSEEGRMLSISLSGKEISKYISENVSLSVINSDNNCVISGDISNIEKIKSLLLEDNVEFVELSNTRAFHSHLLTPYFEEFKNYVNDFKLCKSKIDMISNVTGNYINTEICTGEYWARHLCNGINFNNCVEVLLQNEHLLIIEIGTDMLQKMMSKKMSENQSAVSIIRNYKKEQRDTTKLWETFLYLWEFGLEIEWKKLIYDFGYTEDYKKIPLPTYSFDYQVFCLGEKHMEGKEEESIGENYMRRNLSSVYVAPENEIEEDCVKMWEEALGVNNIGIDDDFFELGGHSLIATQIFTEIKETFDVSVKLSQISNKPTIRVLVGIIVEELMKKI